MISWIDIVGYTASILVALSFFSKMMIPLRIFALCSNAFFITYSSLMTFTTATSMYPVLLLHLFLVPTNILRLVQIIQLNKKVQETSKGDCSIKSLIPFMDQKEISKGRVSFS